jgi:hypothetical protein
LFGSINRVNGYTGSVRFTLGQASADKGASQDVPELELLPPNVRMWAERLTDIEKGLTAGEERDYLIGHEGASTSRDMVVGWNKIRDTHKLEYLLRCLGLISNS